MEAVAPLPVTGGADADEERGEHDGPTPGRRMVPQAPKGVPEELPAPDRVG